MLEVKVVWFEGRKNIGILVDFEWKRFGDLKVIIIFKNEIILIFLYKSIPRSIRKKVIRIG